MKFDKEHSLFQKEFDLFVKRNLLDDYELHVYKVIAALLVKNNYHLNLNLLYERDQRVINRDSNSGPRLIIDELKMNSLKEMKINWKMLDSFCMGDKKESILCQQIDYIGYLLKFLEGQSFVDLLKMVQSLANESSSYLLPLLINENEKVNFNQIEIKGNILYPNSRELICFKENRFLNNGNIIKPLCSETLENETILETFEFLKMLSTESTIMSKMTSEYSTSN
jgi:hypothetical protein